MKIKFTYTVPASVLLATVDKATRKRHGMVDGEDRVNTLWWTGALSFGDQKGYGQYFKNKPTQRRLDYMLAYVQSNVKPYPVTLEVIP